MSSRYFVGISTEKLPNELLYHYRIKKSLKPHERQLNPETFTADINSKFNSQHELLTLIERDEIKLGNMETQ